MLSSATVCMSCSVSCAVGVLDPCFAPNNCKYLKREAAAEEEDSEEGGFEEGFEAGFEEGQVERNGGGKRNVTQQYM